MKITNTIDYKKTTIALSILLILASLFILVNLGQRYGYMEKRYGGEGHIKMSHDMNGDMPGMNHDMSSMNRVMMDMTSNMKGKSGAELDKAFLSDMIVHHQSALDMAEMLKASTARPELKAFADSIIMTQSKEVDQMKAWQKEWFNQ